MKAKKFYKSTSGNLLIIDMVDSYYMVDIKDNEISFYPQKFEDELGIFKETSRGESMLAVHKVVTHINSIF